nr:multidrug resistance-associated protein 5 [Tanacetum cinerariifolium]
MVNWAEMEVETEGFKARTGTTKGVKARNSTTDGVKARTRTKDKGKEKVSKDASDVVKTRRCIVEFDTESEYQSDDDSDYQSDKSVEYLNPGEDELIELRNRMKANIKAKTKAKDKPDSKINEPNEENIMPGDNVRDPFIFVEKHVEKYPMYDETTHWRLRKPKVGEKSGKERAVAKCRQRPPRVFTPEKGKQRKQTKYPYASSDVLPKCSWRCYPRFYVCFVRLVDGWKAGCGKIIALDGCFLKSPNQGEILTAISRDDNNQIYPVAWAVVNVENKNNWTWFLELLEEDLGCSKGNGLTLMSDQHKGLIEAVKDVMPNAEHRQCARHIYESFRKQYTGLEYRQLFWATSKASYPQLFNKIIDKIKSANSNAHKYLMDKNPKTWSRAFFEVDKGCEAIENGFSECFNSMIVNVRHKPLLTILEAIRVIVLERMNKLRKISRKWNPRPDQSMYSTVLPPKPRKMLGRPKKKRIRAIGEGGSSTRVSKDVDVHRGPVRDEGAGWTRGGVIRSRGRGAGGSGGNSVSRGKGAGGSRGRGVGGSKRKTVSTSGTQIRQGKKTQAEAQQTQQEHEKTQVEDQLEHTEDQAEIDLTQVEQTQEQIQEQVQPQEQPQQPQKQPQEIALRMPSASILQRKLGKQGNSQNTALNLD